MRKASHFASGRIKSLLPLALLALFSLPLTGCIVAGVGPGGAFIWPGGLGLVVILLVVFFLLRRR